MEAIARAAGVATPTVYALFGSKRNILAELIARTAFGPAYQDLVGETMALATRWRVAGWLHESPGRFTSCGDAGLERR